MNRAVFLDRDGVINRAMLRNGRSYPPASIETFELLPQVPEAFAILRAAGFRMIVVTNQPDVVKGLQRREVVEAMHERLRQWLPIDAIKVCYHTDQDNCSCRKPKPGMLLEAAREWDLDLSQCVMVGDRWRDIEAGKAAGCRTILIRTILTEPLTCDPDAVVASLYQAGKLVLSQWANHQSEGVVDANR